MERRLKGEPHVICYASLFIDSDPATSLVYAQKAVAAASRAGDTAEHINGLIVMLSLETRRGNSDRAAAIERQMAELSSSDASRMIFILSSQAHRKAWLGEYADAARLFGGILDRQPHVADRLIVRMLHALCLSLAQLTKQSAASLTEALAILDPLTTANPVQAGWSLDCALMFGIMSEIVAGRLTSAGRLLKREPLDQGEFSLSMRRAAENLLRRAKAPSFEEPLDDALEVVRSRGYGGYARYIEICAEVISSRRDQEPSLTLTPTELRILRYLASGLAPKDIAAEMDRSVYTIQTHIQNLSEKLGSHGRAGTIAAGRRLGFLDG